jgi:hypothetical protein
MDGHWVGRRGATRRVSALRVSALRVSALCVAALAVTGCAAPTPAPTPTPDGSASPTAEDTVPTKLRPHARDLLTRARRRGDPTVLLLVSAVQGRTDEAAAQLRGLGGAVHDTDSTVGYVKVSMPTAAVERAAALPSVSAIDLDEPIPRREPAP